MLVISVSKDLMVNITLVVLAVALMIIYMIYVIIDERKKWKMREFFKYKIYYEIDCFLYIDMVKKRKKCFLKRD